MKNLIFLILVLSLFFHCGPKKEKVERIMVDGVAHIMNTEKPFRGTVLLDIEKTLSFELISPKDPGLSLDPKTGEINWDLSEDTIKKWKDKIEIKFKVIKKGAPEVSSSITLTFSRPEEQKQG